MREPGSPERRAPRETDCGRVGSAELFRTRRRRCRHRRSGPYDDRTPRGQRGRHARKEWTAKARNHPRVPRRSRTAKALRISRHAVKSQCARGWGGWGRLSDDGARQHNLHPSEDPWGGGLPHLHGGARSNGRPDTAREYRNVTKCAKGGHKPTISQCMPGAGLSWLVAGRCRSKCQPSSRIGENPPYGMIGRVEETSASFEARSAPRLYPTAGGVR
jgi:hypothetical protein